MQLNIGQKIRELRRRDGRTQEALAEAIGVTSQAVSRWEANGGYPDMEMIPAIANYFGVTIDELFGHDNEPEKEIVEIVDRLNQMNDLSNINISEYILLARNTLIKYPSNTKIMLCLAWLLVNTGYKDYHEHHITDSEGYDRYDVQRHRTYAEWTEAIAIYEKVLPTLADGPDRHRAVKQLANLYLCTGEHQKAAKLAETVPDIHCCREFLEITTCDGKERSAKYAQIVMKLLSIAAELIGDTVAANYDHINREDVEKYILNAATIFDAICPDGEYGTYRDHSAYLYLYLSTHQWRNGKKDEAFTSLYKALEHIKKCERFSKNADMTFDSPLLKNVKINPKGSDYDNLSHQLPSYWPWICIPGSNDVAAEMQADPRWNEWVARTQE